MTILRLVDPRIFRMFEENLRRSCKDGKVRVYYVAECDDHSVKVLHQITTFINNECPAVREEDMEVMILKKEISPTHADRLCILAKLPINDYLRLRNNSQIFVR